jgi:hypothetical protein
MALEAHGSTPESTASHSTELERIAVAAVRLGSLGPRLAALADDMAVQARDQARRVEAVAGRMEQLTIALDEAIGQLRGSSAQVESALGTVARIADHTRILAINASIEASRAGVHGRPFGIVVEEVQRLADRTGQTTSEIEARVKDMHASIARVAAMTGHADEPLARGFTPATDASKTTASVSGANQQIRNIADSVGRQMNSVEALSTMGTVVKAGTEALLLAIGTFRFAAHARAEKELGALLADIPGGSLDRARLETSMRRWIERHPHFELAYITDARGRQIVDNIVCEGGCVRHDANGYGRDWSARPWFRHAAGTGGIVSTDIYRSSATGDFCFTISVALRQSSGAIRAVVGADVNFQQLLSR